MIRLALYFALLFCTAHSAVGQSLSTHLGYALGLAPGEMGQQMDPLHGFNVEMTFAGKESRFAAGLGFTMGWYDSYRRDVEVSIDGQPAFDAPMVVQHHMANLSAVLRYDLIEAGPIVPFATFRPGWLFVGTRLEVRDPNRSANGEGPINLLEESLHRDNAFAAGAAFGARFDLAVIFQGLGRNMLFLEAEAGYMIGPEVSYAFSERENGARGPAVAGALNGFERKESEFHDIHIYRSTYSMLSFRVGFTFRLAPSRDEE